MKSFLHTCEGRFFLKDKILIGHGYWLFYFTYVRFFSEHVASCLVVNKHNTILFTYSTLSCINVTKYKSMERISSSNSSIFSRKYINTWKSIFPVGGFRGKKKYVYEKQEKVDVGGEWNFVGIVENRKWSYFPTMNAWLCCGNAWENRSPDSLLIVNNLSGCVWIKFFEYQAVTSSNQNRSFLQKLSMESPKKIVSFRCKNSHQQAVEKI